MIISDCVCPAPRHSKHMSKATNIGVVSGVIGTYMECLGYVKSAA